MQKFSLSALLAAATVFVFPRRAEITADAHELTLVPPMLPVPRAVCAMPRAKAETPAEMIAEIQANWNEFKGTVEANLGKKAEDAVVVAKLDTINADIAKITKALDAQATQIAAARLGGADAVSPEVSAHSDAFDGWFRRGRDPEAGMRTLEVAARLTTQSDPDGGYLVPTQMEQGIDRVLGAVSAVRSVARVVTVGTSEYKKLVSMGGATSGWVGEEDDRPETATPVLREIAINTGEIYANPYATQTMLDDAMFDVATWLAEEVSIEFAEQEGNAFINGNGMKKPRGFLTYDTVANAGYGVGKASAWGKIGYVASGANGGFAAAVGTQADCLIDLYYALRSGYRNGASFITSDAVMGTIRKFKDGQGNYLWAPPTGVDMPATILGKPVLTDDYMPGLANNSLSVAIANFNRAYTVLDRMGTRVLRDPYTKKPFVGFYTTKRVGGGVTNFEAIKLLKFSAN